MNTPSKLTRILGAALAAITTAFASNAKAAPYTTADYAQDGLVAMWDCSSGLDATGWTTCYASDANDYTFAWTGAAKGSIVYSATDGVLFSGRTDAYGLLTPDDCTSTFKAAANGTMEVVFVDEDPSGSSAYQVVMQVSQTYGSQALFLWGGLIRGDGKNKTTNAYSPYEAQIDKVRTVSFGYTGNLEQEANRYLDGTKLTEYSSAQNFGNGTLGAVIGRRQAAGGSGVINTFIGRIMAIRLYSTKLTAEQVAANAAVDRARFAAKVLVANADETKGTVTGAGEYNVGTAIAATAEPAFGHRFAGWFNDDGTLVSTSKTLNITPARAQHLTARFDDVKSLYDPSRMIAMWDCSVNVDATGWTDVSGKYKFVWTGAKANQITYSRMGVQFPGDKDAYGLLSEDDTGLTFKTNTTMHVEVTYAKDTSTSMFVFQTATKGYPMVVDTGSEIIFNSMKDYSKNNYSTYSSAISELMTVSQFFDAMYTPRIGYVNGELSPSAAYANNYGVSGTGTIVGNRGSLALPFSGRIMSIRLYWNELDGTRMAQNAAVDTARFNPAQSTVRVRSADESQGTVSGGGTDVAKGTDVTLTAEAKKGYVFNGWTGDVDGLDASANPLVFSADIDRDIEATFAVDASAKTVTFNTPTDVSVVVTAGGVAISSGATVPFGTDVITVATPKDNYEYSPVPDGWTKVADSDAITCTKTVGGTDLAIEVPAGIVEKPKYTLTLSDCTNGSISGEGGEYYRDTQVELTAVPDSGYRFANWTGNASGTENPTTVVIDGDKTVGAVFELIPQDAHVVFFNGGENSSYTVTVDDEPIASGAAVTIGKTVVVKATPNAHYAFPATEGWTSCEPAGSITKSFTVADQNISIDIPDAELIYHLLTINQPERGSITGAESGDVAEGTEITLTANLPGSSWEFLGWTGDASGTENPLVFTMDTAKTIGASIAKIARAVTYNTPANADVLVTANGAEIASGALVEYGLSVVVSSDPAGDYEYLTVPEGWTKDKSGFISRSYTMANQAIDIEIPAPTEIPSYTLTISDCVNGSITGTAGSYQRDTEVELTAVPAEGYVFDRWTGDVTGGNGTSQKTVEISKDMTVGAIFRVCSVFDQYEKDGLVAMWDCAAGLDETGWTSCISSDGGDHIFNWTGANKAQITYSATKGVTFPGDVAAYALLSLASTEKTFDLAVNGTMEVVFSHSNIDANAFALQVGNGNNSSGKSLSLCFYQNSGKKYICGTSVPVNLANYDAQQDLVRTAAFRYTDKIPLWSGNNSFLDASALTEGTYNAGGFTDYTSGTILGVRKSTSLVNPFAGRILAIRLYSTKLSDEQIAAHYALDQQRFDRKGLIILIK